MVYDADRVAGGVVTWSARQRSYSISWLSLRSTSSERCRATCVENHVVMGIVMISVRCVLPHSFHELHYSVR